MEGNRYPDLTGSVDGGMPRTEEEVEVEDGMMEKRVLVIGGGIAGVYQVRALMPAFAIYIDIGFFVIVVGLGASGAYSLIDEHIPKKG